MLARASLLNTSAVFWGGVSGDREGVGPDGHGLPAGLFIVVM
jgi:hypothetical protein